MMNTKQEQKGSKDVVLAIYPNSLGFGYAVMKNALEVISAKVVPVRPVCNRLAFKRIKDIIGYYEPKIIVLEDYKGIGSRKSKRIQKIIDKVCVYANTQNLEIKSYSRAKIRYVFSHFNAHTKYEIATVISENIEGMKDKLMENRKTGESEKYTVGAFDAVSLVVTYFYVEK